MSRIFPHLARALCIALSLASAPLSAEPPSPSPTTSPAESACGLKVVHFDFDEVRLRPEAAARTRHNAACLLTLTSNKRCSPLIAIVGHADRHGTEAYALAIGARYARSVKRGLVREGVPAEWLVERSRGRFEPADEAPNAAAQARNRRVELEITHRCETSQ